MKHTHSTGRKPGRGRQEREKRLRRHENVRKRRCEGTRMRETDGCGNRQHACSKGLAGSLRPCGSNACARGTEPST